MGGKLSKKKKACNEDPNDKNGADTSETATIEQQENETEAEQEQSGEDTLKEDQLGSDASQCEAKLKNGLKVEETINEEREREEATQDQTKEGKIPPTSENVELVQTKKSQSNELLIANCPGTHHVPEIGSSITTEKTCGETVPATTESQTEGKCQRVRQFLVTQTEEKSGIESEKEPTSPSPAEKPKKEIHSDSMPENIPTQVSVDMQTKNGADISVENTTECIVHNEKNNVDVPVCAPTENYLQSAADKQDTICSHTEPLSEKHPQSKPTGTEIIGQDNCPILLPESSMDKKKSDGDKMDIGQLNSDDDTHIVCHVDILPEIHRLNNSDNLGMSSHVHKDESYNSELLGPTQDVKPKDKATPHPECLNLDNDSILKQSPEKEDCIATEQAGPEDQESFPSQTKPSIPLVPELETPFALEGSLAAEKIEVQAEAKVGVGQIIAVTPTETEGSLNEIEGASQTESKCSMTQVDMESTAMTDTSVTQVQVESSNDPEVPVDAVDGVSLVELVPSTTPDVKFSSSKLEATMALPEATSQSESEDCKTLAMVASFSEPQACETTVKADSPTELEEGVAQIEVSSAELEPCQAPTNVQCPVEMEISVAQTQMAGHSDLGGCVAERKGTSPSELEPFVAPDNVSTISNSETCTSTAEACPAEPESCATPTELEQCVPTANEISNIANLAACVTPKEASSTDQDTHTHSAEVVIPNESDACSALEKQGVEQISGEGQASTETMCQVQSEHKVDPAPVQEKDIHFQSIPVKEAEIPNDSDIRVPSEHIICEAIQEKCDGVSNGIIKKSDSEILGEPETPIATNGSPNLLHEQEEV